MHVMLTFLFKLSNKVILCSGNFVRAAADPRQWPEVYLRLHPGHQGPVRLRPRLRAGGRAEAVVLRQRRLELAGARDRRVHPGESVQHHAGHHELATQFKENVSYKYLSLCSGRYHCRNSPGCDRSHRLCRHLCHPEIHK